MNSFNIQSKVILLAIAPLIITISILSYLFISERIEDTDIALHDKGEAIINQLAHSTEFGLFSENIPYLESISQLTLQDEDVYSIRIINKYGEILIDIINQTDNKKTAMPTITTFREIYSSPLEIDEFSGPDNNISRYLGKISLQLSKKRTQDEQHRIITNSFLLVLFSIVTTSFIAIQLAKGITSPILKLTQAMRAIKNGMFDQNINTNASGEIAVLEQGLKEMTTSLLEARKREKEIAEQQIFLEKTKAQITLESIGEGVITTNKHGYIIYINPAAEKLLQTTLTEAEGQPLSRVFRILQNTDKEVYYYPYKLCLSEGKEIAHDLPIKLARTNGSHILIHDVANPIYDRNGEITGMVLVFHDFTSTQKLSDKILYQAAHDQLTGLLNRHEFETQIRSIINSGNSSTIHSMCFFDLDKFKLINDSCGHHAGDDYLKRVANEFIANVRKNDLVARIGGDEFAVFFRDCPAEKSYSLASTIVQAINSIQFVCDSQVFQNSASAGIVAIDTNNYAYKDLMYFADSACYKAKQQGGNTVNVFSFDDLPDNQFEKSIHIAEYPHQINKDSMVLLAQRIMPLRSSLPLDYTIYDIDIGLRTNNSVIFLKDKLTEEDSQYLTHSLDNWVITSLMSLLDKQEVDLCGIHLNINLSSQALADTTILENLVNLFEKHSLSYNNISFEVSENTILSNKTNTLEFMKKLRELGFQFTLNDFGRGICSLAYLKQTPVNKIKISEQLINGISEDGVNLAILNAINHVAHALNIKTIVQNVSDQKIISLLQNTNIDYIQGYVNQQPVFLEDILCKTKITSQ